MNPKILRNALTAILAAKPQSIHFHQRAGVLTVFSIGSVYVAADVPNDADNFAVQIDRTRALMAALRVPGGIAMTARGDTNLTLFGASWEVSVPCLPSADTPMVTPPMQSLAPSLVVPAVAMPGDLNRYGLACLHIEERRTVCTDGARLVYADSADPLTPGDIPAWMLRGGNGDLSYTFESGRVWTLRNGVVRSQKVVAVDYPRYRDVLPKEYAWTIRGQRSALLAALAAVTPVANQSRFIPTAVTARDGVLRVQSKVVDAGSAAANCSVEIVGEPPTFGMNARFFSDAIRIQPEGAVEITGGRNEEPMRVLGAAGGYVAVIMPQRLNM